MDFAALTVCEDLIITCRSFGGFAAALHSGSGSVFHFDDPELTRTFGNKITSQWKKIVFSTSSEASDWDRYLPSTNSQADFCPVKGSAGEQWLQNLYSKVAKTANCVGKKRIGGEGDGGKIICLDHVVKNECIVYSLGYRLDFSFELNVANELGCKIYTFDFTVGIPTKVPSGINFYLWCIGGTDEKKAISSDLGHRGEIGQYYTLSSIISKLNPTHSTHSCPGVNY